MSKSSAVINIPVSSSLSWIPEHSGAVRQRTVSGSHAGRILLWLVYERILMLTVDETSRGKWKAFNAVVGLGSQRKQASDLGRAVLSSFRIVRKGKKVKCRQLFVHGMVTRK